MNIKIILSAIATILAIVSYIPYLRDMKRGKTKPHAFSWFIWAVLAYIAGAAQLFAGGGFGAVVALVTATVSLLISVIAYRDGAVRATRGDYISLMVALLAIPIWLFTDRPLYSVIIVSAIDAIGFWPTFRKSFSTPSQETTSTYVLSTVKHCLTVAAQEKYNLTTVLYPASLAVITFVFVAMLIIRKRSNFV